MKPLGIRELKSKASEVLRRVREQGQRYVITYHGRPVATITPVEIPPPTGEGTASGDSWEQLHALGKRMHTSWQLEETSAEVLADMRR